MNGKTEHNGPGPQDPREPATQRFPEPQVTERLPEAPEAPEAPAAPQAPVTDRFPEERVTRRLPNGPDRGAVTDRFEVGGYSEPGRAAPAARPGVTIGELVDDRYRVEEGPLGSVTGEAEVYRCTDTQTGETVALKCYHERVKPKASVLASLLNLHHPDIVTLKAYGTWAGRFYEAMEFCSGGSLMDAMPFDEKTLREYVRQVVSGLQYLHSQGIVHRDIKPNNLFFDRPDRQNVVIGDFGVSSILERDEKVRRTSTADFFTLDYAAPELLDGKEVSPKTDYYALGITLLHLLTGCSPFVHMDKNAILGCHFRGAVPRPEELSPEFRQLVGGLLRVEPENRWGYAQVSRWLEGEPVLRDDGSPDREEAYAGRSVPFRSFPEITTPREMVQRLDEFDAAKALQRGFVSQWLMFFDTELGERVAELEEEYADNPRMGVFKLRYLLDPSQPLHVGDRAVYNIAELVALLAQPGVPREAEVGDLLYSGSIEVWVEAMGAGQQGRELARRIAKLRNRVKDRSLGVFALLYLLDPARPLEISANASIKSPEELEDAIGPDAHIAAMAKNLLFQGRLEEWLRAAFPNRREDIRFVAECARVFKENRDQGFFALRWRFQPSLPFSVGLESAATPKELAAILARKPQSFERGLWLLSRGWIRLWLVTTGRLKDPASFDEVVNDFTTNWSRKLEAVLHLLDPGLPWPVPAADLEYIDGGRLSSEGMRTVRFMVFNAGRGYLAGTVTLEGSDDPNAESAGFVMEPCVIEGEPVRVSVTLSGRGQMVGTHHEAKIVVDTNGGRLEIPVRFDVAAPAPGMLLRSLLAGVLTAEVLGLFRLGLQALMPRYAFTTMEWFTAEYVRAHPGLWVLVPVALAFVAGIGGAAYYLAGLYRMRE